MRRRRCHNMRCSRGSGSNSNTGCQHQGAADLCANASLLSSVSSARGQLRWWRPQTEQVVDLQLEFRRVFDQSHAVLCGHERDQGAEERRLSGPGPTADQDVVARLDRLAQDRWSAVRVPMRTSSSAVNGWL